MMDKISKYRTDPKGRIERGWIRINDDVNVHRQTDVTIASHCGQRRFYSFSLVLHPLEGCKVL